MAVKTSSTGARIGAHFSFYRKAPERRCRLPFADLDLAAGELGGAVAGFAAFVALVAALATAPWWA